MSRYEADHILFGAAYYDEYLMMKGIDRVDEDMRIGIISVFVQYVGDDVEGGCVGAFGRVSSSDIFPFNANVWLVVLKKCCSFSDLSR